MTELKKIFSIIGVGTNNELYTRDKLDSNWVKVPNSGGVIDVTVLPDGKILGVGKNNDLCTRDTLNSNWVNVPLRGKSKVKSQKSKIIK